MRISPFSYSSSNQGAAIKGKKRISPKATGFLTGLVPGRPCSVGQRFTPGFYSWVFTRHSLCLSSLRLRKCRPYRYPYHGRGLQTTTRQKPTRKQNIILVVTTGPSPRWALVTEVDLSCLTVRGHMNPAPKELSPGWLSHRI